MTLSVMPLIRPSTSPKAIPVSRVACAREHNECTDAEVEIGMDRLEKQLHFRFPDSRRDHARGEVGRDASQGAYRAGCSGRCTKRDLLTSNDFLFRSSNA
jgi:hypothetical protein